ncbi:hypothetical protein BHY50_14015 [Listeria monocytogenes]|uniref:hypothetical protein n=1 Tax=Listeria seeligeri TaxID=1640 RepID=UPI0010E404D8|nr:hypothetical protein [Listeria seeligeri]EAE6945579.1 hypothetical protein [Listeria monocytogenes]EAF1164314.1 hypothetical protein [Listeria monocytogenes]EAF2599971.1 hypothetical protein [Listeria monocytogenes]ECB9724980.1 hypothetical protein [Listeria monocytogenes]ECR1110928.1 hypothetical protein [Listeria monocytogenes]
MKILTENDNFKTIEVTFANLQNLADIFKALEARDFKICYQITYDDDSTVSEPNLKIFEEKRYLNGEKGIREIKLEAFDPEFLQSIEVKISSKWSMGNRGINVRTKYIEGEGELLNSTHHKLVDLISHFKVNKNWLTSHPGVSYCMFFVCITLLAMYLGNRVTELKVGIIIIILTIVLYILNGIFFILIVPIIYMDVEFEFIDTRRKKIRERIKYIIFSIIAVNIIGAAINIFITKLLD